MVVLILKIMLLFSEELLLFPARKTTNFNFMSPYLKKENGFL